MGMNMLRYKFKELVEAIHVLSQRKDLSVPLLFGLSKNFELMASDYKSMHKALGPWYEYDEKIRELKLKYNDDQIKFETESDKLLHVYAKVIESTNIFMNEEMEFNPYLIDYHEFPEDIFQTRADMDFWMPILKDGE